MTWSVSLDRTWSRCQRQYFFQHKMAWPTASDEQRKRAQFFKELLSPEMWQGKLVHKVIETIIIPEAKARRWPRPEYVINQAVLLAEKQFAFSHSKTYETVAKADVEDRYCVLAPHYFGMSNERELLDETIDVISLALRNLLSSQGLQAFLMGRRMYRMEKSHYFKVGETTVQAIPDLITPNKLRSGFDIIDWKVATASGRYDFQVAVYGLAVQATDWLFQQAPGDLYGYVINLLEPDPAIALADPYKINEDVLTATMDVIYEKLERIDALVKGRKFEQLNIEEFMVARSVGTCALCNWKTMCVEMSNGTPAKLLPIINQTQLSVHYRSFEVGSIPEGVDLPHNLQLIRRYVQLEYGTPATWITRGGKRCLAVGTAPKKDYPTALNAPILQNLLVPLRLMSGTTEISLNNPIEDNQQIVMNVLDFNIRSALRADEERLWKGNSPYIFYTKKQFSLGDTADAIALYPGFSCRVQFVSHIGFGLVIDTLSVFTDSMNFC